MFLKDVLIKTTLFLVTFIVGITSGNLTFVRELLKTENKNTPEPTFVENRQKFVLTEKRNNVTGKKNCTPITPDLEKLYAENPLYNKLLKKKAEILGRLGKEYKPFQKKDLLQQLRLDVNRMTAKLDLERIDKEIEDIKKKIETTQNLHYLEKCYEF